MTVERELRGHVAIVTLNRPHAANALNVEMRAELVDAWTWIDETPAVRAAVLTGAGEKVFCAGSDLRDAGLDEFDYLTDELYGSPPRDHFMRRFRSRKPLVCAINGHALGGGLELALATDIRVAAESASFGFPEVTVGSMPGAGGTQRLPRMVSLSDTMYLLLTGERVSAADALRMGLVTKCLPFEDVLPAAVAIAERIARNAPMSVLATRDAVLAGLDLPMSHGLAYERHLFGLVRGTRDRSEGRQAFREGRLPDYEGK